MSTFTSEPGTRLGGRYRLEDRLAAAGGWSAWKAIDEILARPVSVITFAAGFPRLQQVVTAARAASRLTDTRLTQVFDVEDDWDRAYTVLEWPVGDTLTDLIAAGPMEPLAGARIVAEVASALAGAHAAGLAHLCLRPDSVRWTAGGGVKVTGLGIDAALSGATADDPALADTRGLGELLYAALTGQWPGPDYPGLPAAPLSDGQLRRPRQVRAGVPTALDEIAGRALALPGRDGQIPFASPAEIASTLASVIPPVQVPPATVVGRDSRRETDRQVLQRQQTRHQAAQMLQTRGQPGVSWRDNDGLRGRNGSGSPGAGPGRRGNAGKLAALTLAVVVAVVGATAAVYMLRKPHNGSSPGGGSPPSGSPGTRVTAVPILSAQGFDPLNLSDTGDENSAEAANVIHDHAAGWSTQEYIGPFGAYFGRLKQGAGLMLALSKPVRITSVTITFGKIPGADVQLKLGDSDARSPQNLASMTTVARLNDVAGSTTFTVTSKATGQYLLIWFTKLPPALQRLGNKPTYAAQVYSVSVRGAS
ncbi:MAG: protein kinase family protein [Streptosporangiaceae bacterium]